MSKLSAYIFIDFKKIFLPRRIRELYHGLCIIEKKKNSETTFSVINKQVKNTKLSGKIVPQNDIDFNSLFFDVNISDYFPTTIRLYPENRSPRTPDLSNLKNLNSIDSGIDTVDTAF